MQVYWTVVVLLVIDTHYSFNGVKNVQYAKHASYSDSIVLSLSSRIYLETHFLVLSMLLV